MRKIKEILRLKHQGLSSNAIAGACRIARSTVQEHLKRAQAAGLQWPLPEDLSDIDLDRLLFAEPDVRLKKPLPDFGRIHTELARKGVTLQLLWQEYRREQPDGYGYTQFCQHYRRWARTSKVSMRQEHKAGEKLFVDFAGMTMEVIDPASGEPAKVQIFVGALGASNYIFACAVPGQDIASWLSAHVRAFRFYGGVPEIVVPDNLKAGVTKACRYDPDINPAYQDLAEHYGVAVIPARVRKPKDKAKVEVAVQIVERWVLAPLRNRRFFSIPELNDAMAERLVELNGRTMRSYGVSRKELFESLDRPALKPLPRDEYELAVWKKARVNLDYHVEFDRHYYSVPFALAHQEVEIRAGERVVEVYHKSVRVASHQRSHAQYKHTTDPAHMPPEHQRMKDATPAKIRSWAKAVGPSALEMVEEIIKARPHPEQGYRSCLGLLRLERTYGRERLENACSRALHYGLLGRRHVLNILESGQDRIKSEEQQNETLPGHGNIRGPQFYQ